MASDITTVAIETECGWKGSVVSPPRIESITDTTGSTPRTLSSMVSSSLLTEEDGSWLGGERHLLPEATERRGVAAICAALTEAEKEQVQAFDTTMPIRHFRAEKVLRIAASLLSISFAQELSLETMRSWLNKAHCLDIRPVYFRCRLSLWCICDFLGGHCEGHSSNPSNFAMANRIWRGYHYNLLCRGRN